LVKSNFCIKKIDIQRVKYCWCFTGVIFLKGVLARVESISTFAPAKRSRIVGVLIEMLIEVSGNGLRVLKGMI
jgi:hypothetical protein